MSELDQYDYTLPERLIAQRPLRNRMDARLMVVDRQSQTIDHRHVRDLPDLLKPHDCLVLNDTKVVPARLVGFRTLTKGRWQGLFLQADERGLWHILGKTRGKIEVGETVTLEDRDSEPAFELELLAKQDGGRWVCKPKHEVEEPFSLLERVGRVPLPHYIRGGEMDDADVESYQTVFAENPGAVAAPTAGLHFTPALMQRCEASGAEFARVTLHVGIGTFRPIQVDRLSDHVMHSEWGSISEATATKLNEARQGGGRIVCVGTTSVRTIESAAATGELAAWQGETDLFIRPPYQFAAVDALLTNFHLPKSTLLVLVRTLGGDELLREAYRQAVEEEYRFFSYGDAMLIC